jgi:RecB family exonuclease
MPDSSSARVLEYTRHITRRLLGSSVEAICSWPALQEGEELHPSPLVPVSAASTRQPGAAGELWNDSALAQAVLELLEQDPPPPFPHGATVRGGVSVLNLQAVSPLNAFIEKRLGAFEMRVPPVGINAMQRGNLTHRALEDLYRAHPSQAALAALASETRMTVLRESLQRGLKQLPGSREAFMQKLAALELEQQLDRLQRFLAIDLARPDFAVVSIEEPREVSFGPLNLRLKLDRLDRLPDGQMLVIDYKTGRVNRQAWNPRDPRDMQLPLYVTAVVPGAAAISFAQISVQGVGYDGVGSDAVAIAGIRSPGKRQTVQVRYQRPQTDDVIESWEELREIWADVLLGLAEAFAAGDYRLDPRNPQSATGQFAVLSRVFDAGLGVLED